jgi:hypothetical protein
MLACSAVTSGRCRCRHARAAGLIYAQRIVLVHGAIRGGQFAPDPATGIVGLPGVCCVHSGLLVFTKPGKPASSAELKDSRR